MWRWCVLSFVFLPATFLKVHAQPQLAMRQYGGVFLTGLPKAQYLRDSYSSFTEISIQQQTTGTHLWQRANGLPQVGLAAFFGNSGSRQYLGYMAGIFPYISWRLWQAGRYQSRFRAGAGAGWVQKTYNTISNYKNVIIGTHVNAYLSFLWEQRVAIGERLDLNAGISFSHFSNGSTTLPNLGLNIPALSIGVLYHAKTNRPPAHFKKPTVNKQWQWALYTSAGVKQFPWVESKRYVVNVLQAEGRRAFTSFAAYTAGTGFFYDRALEVDPRGIPDLKRTGNKWQASVYAGYEHLLGRLSVPVQLGVYVANHDINASLFQQIGFRYNLSERTVVSLLMKTHSGKADFVHLGFGYRFKKMYESSR